MKNVAYQFLNWLRYQRHTQYFEKVKNTKYLHRTTWFTLIPFTDYFVLNNLGNFGINYNILFLLLL